MKKIIRTLIITFVISGLLSLNCEYALSMNLNIFKKQTDAADTKKSKTPQTVKKSSADNNQLLNTKNRLSVSNKIKSDVAKKNETVKQSKTEKTADKKVQITVKSNKTEQKNTKIAQNNTTKTNVKQPQQKSVVKKTESAKNTAYQQQAVNKQKTTSEIQKLANADNKSANPVNPAGTATVKKSDTGTQVKANEKPAVNTKQNTQTVKQPENKQPEQKADAVVNKDNKVNQKQKSVKSNETKKVKEDKKSKTTKKSKNDTKSKKDKKEKYDDSVVTAKTHETQPSVKIIIKSDKGKKKVKNNNEKQVSEKKKVKNKKSKKNKNGANEPKEREIILKHPAEKTENVPEADVFSSTAAVEGSVSTTRIISVDDCVKIALENNPSILSQLISKDIYKNQIAQAWSNYFPTLNASASYSRNDMLVTNFKFPMQKYNQWYTPNIGVNLLIYDFGKTGAQAGIAKKTYEASRETLQSSINDVVYQVKNAYYNQLFLQQQVQVYEDSVLQYQIHLEQAKAYYAIGSKAKIDVSTAELNLDNTKLTLVQAKNAVETGFAQLTNAMGVPEFEKFEIQDRLDKRRYDISFNESLKIACDQNPTLLAAKKKMEGSKLLVKSAKVAFLPDITGFGSYSRGGGEPSKDYGYQLGAQISYTNLNLLLLKQRVDEATLTYKKDQADYETQRQKLYLDVKQAYIQLKNAQESIPVARASMNVAKERYDLAAGRYKAGLGDAIEIKDAQITYQNAKLQFYNTLMQYHISAANLERVIGAPLTATEVNL